MVSALPWLAVALCFWVALYLSIDKAHDKLMAYLERWRHDR